MWLLVLRGQEPRRHGGAGLQRDLLAIPVHHHGGLPVAVVTDQPLELAPVGDRDAVERDELVADLDAGLGGRCRSGLELLGRARPTVLLRRHDAALDLGDRGLDGLVAGVAVGGEDAGEDEEGDQDVHRRPAGHHDDLLPPRQLVEEAVVVLRTDQLPLGRAGVGDELGEHAGVGLAHLDRVLDHPAVGVADLLDLVGQLVRARREHPDDLHVTAERDRLDPVLGLPHLLGPHGGPEADEVLGDFRTEPLRRDHVAQLVQADGDQDREDEDDHAEDVEQDGHRASSVFNACGSGWSRSPEPTGRQRAHLPG